MIIYKIRSADGLFAKGGSWIRFSKTGKVWKRQSDLTQHLQQLTEREWKAYTDAGAEVVSYELMEREIGKKTLKEQMNEIHQRRLDKALKQKEQRDKRELALRRQQYEQLRKEFGNE